MKIIGALLTAILAAAIVGLIVLLVGVGHEAGVDLGWW